MVGRHHRVVTGCPSSVPAAPEWFMNWITTAPPAGHSGSPGSRTPEADVDADQIMARGAPVGERNKTLYRFACSRYRRHGTGPVGCAEVIAELRQAWQASGTAGMPWREVLTIAQSARRFITEQDARTLAAFGQWQAYTAGRAGR
jgi:hypothetical protein